jgi:hypothetical protein
MVHVCVQQDTPVPAALTMSVIRHVEMVVTVHTTTPAIVIMDSVVHVVRYLPVLHVVVATVSTMELVMI